MSAYAPASNQEKRRDVTPNIFRDLFEYARQNQPSLNVDQVLLNEVSLLRNYWQEL